MNNAERPALWTKDFILAFASNLLMFFSFYMLIPVLPVYLTQQLGTTNSVAGIALSLYTVAALAIRPFSGFMVDTFARKPFYLLCYGLFCMIFAGYVVGTTLTLFIILRIAHGAAFGVATVSGSTVAVDIMPPLRRGEGIGYFGMAANLAMAAGPVAGIWLQKNYSFNILFLAAFTSSLIGWFTITRIKLAKPERPPIPAKGTAPRLTLSNFILVRSLPCVIPLLLAGIGYGSVLNYVGLYSETAPYESSAGLFFTLLSIGIVLARILSAKSIGKGRLIAMIYIGSFWLVLSFTLFALCSNAYMLYFIAFSLGLGYGYLSPAFQTMFIDLAQHNQRGTANATYFTSWDLGIGTGTACGGAIIEHFGFTWLYGTCALLITAGTVYFALISASHFAKRHEHEHNNP